MESNFWELETIANSPYTKEEMEEAERNLLGFFSVLKKINNRLNNPPR